MDGILLYNKEEGRFVVGELIDDVITEQSREISLHCGDTLTIKIKGDWKETRIEHEGEDDIFGWFFVGVGRAAQLVGHSVKLNG